MRKGNRKKNNTKAQGKKPGNKPGTNAGGGHYTKFTSKKKEKFLEILANNGGIVTDAAKDVGISRRTAYNEKEADPEFDVAWERAVDLGVDVLEDEAKRRASEGTEEPVYYQGAIVGTIRRKSDYLMALLLKGHRPRYRKETHEITGADGKPLSSNVIVYLPENDRQKKGGSK